MDMRSMAKACLASMAWMGCAALAGPGFTVSPGNWMVTDEVNGQPGRGMGIEVRDNTLVMAVYNYTPSGEATFHLTVGALDGDRYRGPLMEYGGGRYLGGPAMDAFEVGSVGEVLVHFTDETRGVIQFPGEPPVAISRCVFNGVPDGQFLMPGHREAWLLPANRELADSRFMSASYSFAKDSVESIRPTPHDFADNADGAFDSPAQDWVTGDAVKSSVPEAGMWIVSDEKTGRPGRGLTLELQMGALVVQFYGYEPDGSPTFRMGAGVYENGAASIPLLKVKGGRYYGSQALTGVGAGSDGEALIRFTSPVRGMILLPGEQWVEMQKF